IWVYVIFLTSTKLRLRCYVCQRSEPLTDGDQTDLLAEQARHELLQRIHSIYAPCEVQIQMEERQLGPWTVQEPSLVYPVPDDWHPHVTDANLYDLITSGQWGWEHGEPITGQALMSRWRQGLHDGLRGGADTSRLLNDVVALARDTQGTT